MDVREAIATRYSCRAFLPTPVPLDVVRDILDRAARAPSGGNLQPWLVHALAGERLEELKSQLRPRFAKELPRGEGAEYQVYPRRAEGAVLRPPLARRDAALRLGRHPARGPARALSPVLAQLSVLRRAGRAVRLDRPHHGAAAMVGRRRLHPEHHAAGARPRPAHLPAGSLDLLAQDRLGLHPACLPSTSCFAASRSATRTRPRRSTAGAPSASRSRRSRPLRGSHDPEKCIPLEPHS